VVAHDIDDGNGGGGVEIVGAEPEVSIQQTQSSASGGETEGDVVSSRTPREFATHVAVV